MGILVKHFDNKSIVTIDSNKLIGQESEIFQNLIL